MQIHGQPTLRKPLTTATNIFTVCVHMQRMPVAVGLVLVVVPQG
ncbi:MAG: hypothetical protein WCX29_01135 [Candidatus Peribacteraceae bacterium]